MLSSEGTAYTVDTLALLGYLADRLPAKANNAFAEAERGDAMLIVPSIVVGESLFTLLKGKMVFGVKVPAEKLLLFLDALEKSPSVRLQDMGVEEWRKAVEIDLPELHDRMVVATFLLTKSTAILTNDEEISGLKGVKTLWR